MNPLIQIIDGKFQSELMKLIMDKLVEHIGLDAFESAPLTFIGATLDCQIQAHYAMHAIYPEGLQTAKENLIASAHGR